jgi:uncharacterized membrane protein
MEPALTVALAWLAFGIAHIGLALIPVRSRIVAAIGEQGFVFSFSGVAAVVFTFVVTLYAGVRFDGAPGLALGRFDGVREALIALVVAGVVLMTGAFAAYDRSPYAGLEARVFPPPLGLERITRHPFFAGLVLFSLAHALLATRLSGAVFMLGQAAVAAAGSWHQDRKLLARFGAPFEAYLRETSHVPFAAIVTGRQRLVWGELPVRTIGLGLAIAFVLRLVHGSIFAYGGAAFLAVMFGAIVVIAVVGLRQEKARIRERRAASEKAGRPAA